jgi:hypothetical protein
LRQGAHTDYFGADSRGRVSGAQCKRTPAGPEETATPKVGLSATRQRCENGERLFKMRKVSSERQQVHATGAAQGLGEVLPQREMSRAPPCANEGLASLETRPVKASGQVARRCFSAVDDLVGQGQVQLQVILINLNVEVAVILHHEPKGVVDHLDLSDELFDLGLV